VKKGGFQGRGGLGERKRTLCSREGRDNVISFLQKGTNTKETFDAEEGGMGIITGAREGKSTSGRVREKAISRADRSGRISCLHRGKGSLRVKRKKGELGQKIGECETRVEGRLENCWLSWRLSGSPCRHRKEKKETSTLRGPEPRDEKGFRTRQQRAKGSEGKRKRSRRGACRRELGRTTNF